MKIFSFIAICLLLAQSFMVAAEPDRSAPPAQHKPFISWITAIKTSDIEGFKSVYSESMQKSIAKKGWQKFFKKYKEDLDDAFGDYGLTDFEIVFQPGKNDKGKLNIRFKGKKFADLDIIKEDDKWKINEF